jgi:hypothetical protein
MLYFIDHGVAALLDSDAAEHGDFDGITYLALGAAEGNHRIVGSRKTLLDLARNDALSLKTRKVFERSALRVSQEGNLHSKFKVYGRVIAEAVPYPTSVTIGQQRTINFPLRWFDVSAKVQPTVLLGEDLSDARVLTKVGEVGAFTAQLAYIPLSSYADHGGGSGTPDVLEQHAQHQRLCICVVDSDRASPGGTLGGTASSVQRFKNEITYPLVDVVETAGRDLENILPDYFYQSAYGSHARYGPLTALLRNLSQSEEHDLRAHIDVENGIILKPIYAHAAGSLERTFWLSKLPTLTAHLGISPAAVPCMVGGTCANQAGGANCSCVIITGNASDILDKFYTLYKDASRYEIGMHLEKSVATEWQRIGSRIANWCCGDEVLRA